MEEQDIQPALRYFGSGEFPESELVIGLVGAVGAGLSKVLGDLKTCLQHYSYEVREVRVSEQIIPTVVEVNSYDETDEYQRISRLMDAGDQAREVAQDNGVLALGAASLISGTRERTSHSNGRPLCRPRHAYIINSLKHPDEVKVLRHVYGDGFYLLGVYCDKQRRKSYLKRRMTPAQADELIERDEMEEGKSFGQRTRDTFHLADFFLHLDKNEDRRWPAVRRILNLVFGNPYTTPTFDEFAMFMAFSASLRSADLSRQVGAVIARNEEILAMGANDSPRFGGGLYWPCRDQSTGEIMDAPRGRDYARGIDSNDEQKAYLVEEVLNAVKKRGCVAGDDAALRQAIEESPIDDITEYGRVVHAEMEALLGCARNDTSSREATLYCTAFPCHNCAKHIIAAGIKRVVFVEPYPKSKALDFHDDAAFLGFRHAGMDECKVAFEPFVGIGPRRFFDLFSMKHGSGYPLSRKDKETGRALPWSERDGILRMPMLPWAYLEREELAAERFKHYGRRLRNGGED